MQAKLKKKDDDKKQDSMDVDDKSKGTFLVTSFVYIYLHVSTKRLCYITYCVAGVAASASGAMEVDKKEEGEVKIDEEKKEVILSHKLFSSS